MIAGQGIGRHRDTTLRSTPTAQPKSGTRKSRAIRMSIPNGSSCATAWPGKSGSRPTAIRARHGGKCKLLKTASTTLMMSGS